MPVPLAERMTKLAMSSAVSCWSQLWKEPAGWRRRKALMESSITSAVPQPPSGSTRVAGLVAPGPGRDGTTMVAAPTKTCSTSK